MPCNKGINDIVIVKSYLDNGGDPNAKYNCDTLISIFPELLPDDAINEINRVINPNLKETLLSWFVRLNKINNIKVLLAYGANVNIQGGRALLLAVFNTNIEIIQLLLESGVNVRGNKGMIPLRAIAFSNDCDEQVKRLIIKLLIKYGAKLDNKVLYEESWKLLVFSNPTNLGINAGELLEQYVGQHIFTAIRNNDLQTIINHLDEGGYMGIRDKNGNTPLIYAAYCGHVKIVELILKTGIGYDKLYRGIYSEDKNNGGKTALIVAVERGYLEIIKILPHNNLEHKDRQGNTALSIAFTLWSKTEIFELLFNSLSLAIFSRASSGDIEWVKTYLEYGGDVCVKNDEGESLVTYIESWIVVHKNSMTYLNYANILKTKENIDYELNQIETLTKLLELLNYGNMNKSL